MKYNIAFKLAKKVIFLISPKYHEQNKNRIERILTLNVYTLKTKTRKKKKFRSSTVMVLKMFFISKKKILFSGTNHYNVLFFSFIGPRAI
jgi:hypothetical protein